MFDKLQKLFMYTGVVLVNSNIMWGIQEGTKDASRLIALLSLGMVNFLIAYFLVKKKANKYMGLGLVFGFMSFVYNNEFARSAIMMSLENYPETSTLQNFLSALGNFVFSASLFLILSRKSLLYRIIYIFSCFWLGLTIFKSFFPGEYFVLGVGIGSLIYLHLLELKKKLILPTLHYFLSLISLFVGYYINFFANVGYRFGFSLLLIALLGMLILLNNSKKLIVGSFFLMLINLTAVVLSASNLSIPTTALILGIVLIALAIGLKFMPNTKSMREKILQKNKKLKKWSLP